jgi:hypothetical protein
MEPRGQIYLRRSWQSLRESITAVSVSQLQGADVFGKLTVAYVLIGEEKHVGTQDPLRGASKVRLGTTIKQSLAEWGYPWNETAGIICVDACRM